MEICVFHKLRKKAWCTWNFTKRLLKWKYLAAIKYKYSNCWFSKPTSLPNNCENIFILVTKTEHYKTEHHSHKNDMHQNLLEER